MRTSKKDPSIRRRASMGVYDGMFGEGAAQKEPLFDAEFPTEIQMEAAIYEWEKERKCWRVAVGVHHELRIVIYAGFVILRMSKVEAKLMPPVPKAPWTDLVSIHLVSIRWIEKFLRLSRELKELQWE